MSNVRLVRKDLSQLDPGGALKSAHDDQKQALRNLEVKDYDRLDISYDANGNMSKIVYYQDQDHANFSIGFVADSSANYNNTYFLFNGPKDQEQYYVWFSVDGAGVDPALSNRTGIMVDIQENDAGAIIAMAVQATLSIFFNGEYTFLRKGSVVEAMCLTRGVTTEPANNDVPGLLINSIKEGTETKLRTVYLQYDANGCLISYNSVEQNVKC